MKRNATYVRSKLKDPMLLSKEAQVGVDLTLRRVFEISPAWEHLNDTPYVGVLSPETNKLHVPEGNGVYYELTPKPIPEIDDKDYNHYYVLEPGSYAIEFDQGLYKLCPDENAYIIQRSSLNRVGTRIEGSIFDPGFETDTLGATMFVTQTIIIGRHARVAQIVIETNENVDPDSMYMGTWQGKANL